jgi:hypothetical protein
MALAAMPWPGCWLALDRWSVIDATYSSSCHDRSPANVASFHMGDPPMLFRMIVFFAVMARDGRDRILAVGRMLPPNGVCTRAIDEG